VIQLLENEELRADLRQGAIQKLTNDMSLLRNIILTNQRLIIVGKRFGSLDRRTLFLKDVQGLASSHELNIGALVVTFIFGFATMCCITMIAKDPVAYTGIITFVAAGIWIGSYLFRTTIHVSTFAEDFIFRLEHKWNTKAVDRFVDLATAEIAEQKDAARRGKKD
jgi:hypothetical protein